MPTPHTPYSISLSLCWQRERNGKSSPTYCTNKLRCHCAAFCISISLFLLEYKIKQSHG